jgi:hypothetical protein
MDPGLIATAMNVYSPGTNDAIQTHISELHIVPGRSKWSPVLQVAYQTEKSMYGTVTLTDR